VSQSTDDEDAVRLALVLKPEARSGEGREMTARIAAELGLVETSRGAASISFRVSRVRFEQVFHVSSRPRAAATDELGAAIRPGDVVEGEPAVPDALADYVDAVSVEPPAVMLAGPDPAG
jgi:hypothetical protein